MITVAKEFMLRHDMNVRLLFPSDVVTTDALGFKRTVSLYFDSSKSTSAGARTHTGADAHHAKTHRQTPIVKIA
jgi:hypothetical protein